MCAQPTTATALSDTDTIPLDQMGGVFSDLGRQVMSSKIQENMLLAQAAMEGGPTSIQEALKNKLGRINMGMRELAQKTGVKRKLLLSMLEGRVDMPADIMLKIITASESRTAVKKSKKYG